LNAVAFVVVEVVDVHRRIRGPRGHDAVHDLLEGALLLRVVHRPRTAVGAARPEAEQELASVLPRETGPFEVQEDVSGGWCRQPGEPLAVDDGQAFDNGATLGALLKLDAGLLSQAVIGFPGAP
jgi:hypothetical protein